jgi:hypothetical protein
VAVITYGRHVGLAPHQAADDNYLNLEAVIMKVIGTGLILNLVASIVVFSYLLNHVGIHPAAMFFATFLIGWAFLIIGFIMLLARKPMIGALLIGLGSLVFVGAVVLTSKALIFVPVALVSIVGAILAARSRTKIAT